MTTIPFRRVLALLAVFVLLASSLIVLDRRSYLEPVRTGLDEIVSPMTSTLYDLIDRGASESEIEAELEALRQERDALVADNAALQAENEALEQQVREEAAETRYAGVDLLKANVIRRDPTGTQMFVIIDLGSNDGVRPGMAIVNPDLLVGQVVEVKETTSKVMLIIDSSQQVGAMMLDSKADGIVYGQWQEGGYLVMRHVRSNSSPKEGDWIVTSEFSQSQTRQVPPNIPIGVVSGVPVHDEQTDSLVIQVQPGISDFNSLTVVYVAVIADDDAG
jgi:rod shape-determining protein MreC